VLADHDPATANPSGRVPLNVKNLPYTTVWIEACVIEVEAKKIGVLPTGERGGKPLCTVPFIYDPATRTALSDSQNIVAYLEAHDLASPTVFPPRTRALQAAFTEGARAPLPHIYSLASAVTRLPLFKTMRPRSQVWARAMAERADITIEQGDTLSNAQIAEKIDGVLKVLDEVESYSIMAINTSTPHRQNVSQHTPIWHPRPRPPQLNVPHISLTQLTRCIWGGAQPVMLPRCSFPTPSICWSHAPPPSSTDRNGQHLS
jgi:hypothetical protein